jgi:RimJ/RimL family protein N-acetyltransferase
MFARTKRLTLRPGWAEDAADLAQAIGHESVVTKLARAPWPYGEAEARDFLTQPRGPHEPRFVILEHGDALAPALVGGIGLTTDPDGARQLGYWLAPDAWGRGLATEAGHAVIDMARHAIGLKRLHAWHFLDNPASGKVLRKLGFRPTGRVELRHSRARGTVAPSAAFELDLDEDRAQAEVRMAA